MIPVVALVGRPNVGKSTLFNYLTRTRDALVADFPGLTRDRQYGQAVIDETPFVIVDTGGIGVDDLAVDNLMSKQSSIALDEADIVFFMVDARAGRTAIDEDIAKMLHQSGKKVVLVVNKADGLNEDTVSADFYSLGFQELYAISAAHGRGMHKLADALIQHGFVPEEVPEEDDRIKIAFVGRPNVGKSTLINRILGEERVVVYDMPGTTRDSISIPFSRDGKDYTLIDTAGIRKRARINETIEKFSVIKTIQAVKDSHVCLLLIDGQEGITDQDLHLLGIILEAGKALVVAINKWDNLDEETRADIKADIERRLYFVHFAKIRTISALHGTGVGLLYKDIDQAYAAAMKKFSTPLLTRLLQDVVDQHPPPMVNGRRIKLRYAHAGGHNPPVIVIHGNQLNSLPDSYKRYLQNQFMKHLELTGTPLKIEFKGGSNPFAGKRNTLTARQQHKKNRMIRSFKKKRK